MYLKRQILLGLLIALLGCAPERSPSGDGAPEARRGALESTWTGDLKSRTVHDASGNAHYVSVLERIEGPTIAGVGSTTQPDNSAGARDAPAVYLCDVNARMLLAGELPSWGKVRVYGVRRGLERGFVLDPTTGLTEPARPRAPQDGDPRDPAFTFPVIKAREIQWVRPDGRPRVIWKTLLTDQ